MWCWINQEYADPTGSPQELKFGGSWYVKDDILYIQIIKEYEWHTGFEQKEVTTIFGGKKKKWYDTHYKIPIHAFVPETDIVFIETCRE